MARSCVLTPLWSRLTILLIVLAGTDARITAQTPLGTDFTYQGNLSAPGMPAITTADLQFTLHDAVTGGTQIGAMLPKENVAMVNGVFTLSLDFGAAAFAGDARWLQVAVRSPAGIGNYTPLAPRQPVTAAPFALQTRGIVVDENGRVGIGTETPAKRLSVAGDVEIGLNSSDYRHLRMGGGASDGFLYGSFPAFGDGIHLGYNHFADAAGSHQVNNPGVGTSRISMGNGAINLAASNPGGSQPANRVRVDPAGLHVLGGNITIPPKLRSYTIHPYSLKEISTGDGGIITLNDTGLNVFGNPNQFATSVQLPDGATIVMLEVLGRDAAGPLFDIITTLGRTNFSGEPLEMATVSSADGGSVWQTTVIASPVVDNDTHSYWVRVNLAGGIPPSDATLYAIRILYEITQPLP